MNIVLIEHQIFPSQTVIQGVSCLAIGWVIIRDVSYGIYPFVDGVWELTWDQQVSPRPNLLIKTHHNFISQQGFEANITKANNG